MGDTTTRTITNIKGGAINIGESNSSNTLTVYCATTFDELTRFNKRIDLYNGINNSSINQSGFDLYIKNLVQTGSIYLQTTSFQSGTQDSFIISNISCDILPPTLNLTSTGTINIECPNNLTGDINLFNTLTTGNINFGSTTSTCNFDSIISFNSDATFNSDTTFSSDATFVSNISCQKAIYLRDITYVTTNTPKIFMQDNVLYFDTDPQYDNSYQFYANGNPQLLIDQYTTEIKNTLLAQEDISHREIQILNKVKTISTTSPATFVFPLEQTWMITTTGSSSVVITLPLLDDSRQVGFTFNVMKTGSLTNSVTFTAQSPNLIRDYGSITGFSTSTQMAGGATIMNIYTLEVSAGNFVWMLY